jgi:hypothetical protein
MLNGFFWKKSLKQNHSKDKNTFDLVNKSIELISLTFVKLVVRL